MATLGKLLVDNFFRTDVAITVVPGDSQITVTDASRFPVPADTEYFYLTLVDANDLAEVVRIGNITGNVLTLYVNAGEQTVISNGFSAADSRAELWLTAEAFKDMQEYILELETGGGGGGYEPDNASIELDGNTKLAVKLIQFNHLAIDSVRTDAILAGNVTGIKIADGAVTDSKVANVDAVKLFGVAPTSVVTDAVARDTPGDPTSAHLSFDHIRYIEQDLDDGVPSGGAEGDIVIEFEAP